MTAIATLQLLGQSLWMDNIQRSQLQNGEIARLIDQGEIRGMTSNPTIFNNAIAKSNDYDDALLPLALAGKPPEDIFYQLAVKDIQAAADLFRPLYEQSHSADGYISMEVSPYLAHDTGGTVAEASRLWKWVNRPNLMIKIPATQAGIPAITQAIEAGLNINVTLIFSLARYSEVIDAYLKGLEYRVEKALPIDGISSVASFFVSRVDTKVDALLKAIAQGGGHNSQLATSLMGKAAIANARLAYAQFLEAFSSDRFARLRKHGARLQRPLWASTSTKNPAYRDVLYVEELIGPETVDTIPPQTLVAFRDHGRARLTLQENVEDSQKAIEQIEGLNIKMDQVTAALEEEGVKSFSDSFTALLRTIEEKREAIQA